MRNRRTTRIFTAGILFLVWMPGGARVAAASAKVVQLDVPLVGQEQDVWCWAASTEMILRALGEPDARQCEQATRRVNRHRDEGASELDCCVDVNAPGCLRTGWPRFHEWGFEAESTRSRCRNEFLRELGIHDDDLADRLMRNKTFYAFVKENSTCSLSWEEITGEIDAGFPIAFAHRFNEGGGHMMVAVGYVEEESGERWIIVQDPWPPAPRGEPEKGGDKEVVPWEAFLGGEQYDHWRDYWRIRRAEP